MAAAAATTSNKNPSRKRLPWKYLLLLFIATLFLLFPFVIIHSIDANQLRDRCVSLVMDTTGHHLDTAEDAALRFALPFTFLLDLGPVQIRAQKTDLPLFTNTSCAVQFCMLDLLSRRRFTPSALLFTEGTLRLGQDRKGQDAVKGNRHRETALLLELVRSVVLELVRSVGRLVLNNVELQFEGVPVGTDLSVMNCSMQAKDSQSGISLETEGTLYITPLSFSGPSRTGDFHLIATIGQQHDILELNNLRLSGTLNDMSSTGSLPVTISGNLCYSFRTDVCTIEGLHLTQEDVVLDGKVRLAPDETLPLDGAFKLEPVSLVSLLKRFGLFWRFPTNQESMLEGHFSLQADQEAVHIRPYTLKLDNSNLSGALKYQKKSGEDRSIEADLVIDTLDLNRYLPGSNYQSQGALSLMHGLHRLPSMEMEINADNIRLRGLVLDQLHLNASTSAEVIRIQSLTARQEKGTVEARVACDVTGDTPVLDLQTRLTDVNLGAFLQTIHPGDFQGKGDCDLQLTSQGRGWGELLGNSTGTLKIRATDGAIPGLPILETIRKTGTQLQGLSRITSPGVTDFSRLSASAALTDGVIFSEDLYAESELMQVTGRTRIDLGQQEVEALLTVRLSNADDHDDSELPARYQKPIPYQIVGPWKALEHSVALEELLKAEIKNALLRELQQQSADNGKGTH
ncbi:MAG: hypothetical protein CSA21_03980 [Deltaproteobacteria bacterium]|nr:MAG: hypothetical protein CSA21_03980 [Deltaproteobacteria bacterium]